MSEVIIRTHFGSIVASLASAAAGAATAKLVRAAKAMVIMEVFILKV